VNTQSVPDPEQTRRGTTGRGPLAGLRVLDCSSLIAGPTAAMHLGDYGADVVKVEHPRGDGLRAWGAVKDGVGLYFKMLNRNKRAVTADLHTPLGAEIVRRLAARADAMIENFRPGTLEKWGLGYDVLSAVNPGLVLTRVTGFGQTGPERDRPGFGTSAEAASGFAAINGEADGPPLLPGFALADATAGLAGAFLTLAALQGRAARGGRGQIVDLAIYEPLLTVMGPQLLEFDQLGLVQGRTGSRTPLIAPRNTYRTRDGRWIALSGASPSVFERLCRSLGVPELPADARFRDNQARLRNVEALDAALQAAIARFDQADLLARLDAAEAVAAPVRGVDEVLADPHYRARGSIATVDDAELGPLRMQNAIGRLSATPGGIRHAGPRLGEHNRAVLVDELGFAPAELRAGGIVL